MRHSTYPSLSTTTSPPDFAELSVVTVITESNLQANKVTVRLMIKIKRFSIFEYYRFINSQLSIFNSIPIQLLQVSLCGGSTKLHHDCQGQSKDRTNRSRYLFQGMMSNSIRIAAENMVLFLKGILQQA